MGDYLPTVEVRVIDIGLRSHFDIVFDPPVSAEIMDLVACRLNRHLFSGEPLAKTREWWVDAVRCVAVSELMELYHQGCMKRRDDGVWHLYRARVNP